MMLSSELTQIPIIEERWFGSKTALIRVLHVDDDQLLLEVSKEILSLEGNFEIENVLCVDDAFQKLSLGSYDVILSDYEMPQKDGLQFLKELKEQKSTIPFILFTGKGREEVAIKALNMGAVGYYNKQGDIETVYGELAHGIKTAYELKKVKEQRRQQDLSRKILLDNIPCVAMILEKETRRIIFSNKLAHVQGAVPGKTCYSTCASRSIPCTFCLASKLWETGQPQSLEVEYEGKYYHGIWVPYNENHYVHYIFDITKQKEAEKTIIESNNRYAELFAATPAGVVVYEAINDGENFVFKDFNPTAEKIEKKIKQAVVGQKVTEVFPGVKEFGVFEVFQRVWRSGKSEYFPMSFYKDERDTGSWRENWVYKISDREIVAVYRDVTERKKAEENFVHSEKKFRTLFESIVQGAFWQAADGTLLDVNDSALKIFGISREEFLNRNSLSPKWTVIKEDGTELPGEQHPSMIALRTGKAVRNFTAGVFNPKRNSYVWINVNAIPQFKNVQEMPHEVLVTLHELTEHNKNQALASSRTYSEFDSNIIDSIADPILVINPANYVILAANDAASSEYKIPKEELVGKTCYHATHHLTSPCSASHVCPTKTALETGETTKAEHVHFDKDNNPIIVEIAVHPKKEINGKITEIIHIARNITERKKIEEELRESENRFKKIASQTQGMLYQFKKRPDGTFCVPYTSEAIRSIFGCSPQDVREDFSPIAKAIFNEDLEKVVSSIEDSARKLTPWKCEYRVQVPNHQVKHLWGQSIPEKLSDGSIIWHGYNLDITDRKAMDIAFLENQEKFSALFNSNPDPAVFYNVEFHVVEANPNFCKYFGYSLLELKDRDIAELIVPEEGREESKQVRQKALSGPIEVVGTRMRKDGSLVSVLMAGGPVRLGEKVVGAMFVYKDISDIITVQEALNLALSKAELLNEKLKVVGSLTRHDVRNKLSAVTGYSYLIKKQHSDLADVVNALGRMEQAVKEAMKIFDFAKTYEQIGVENLVDIDVQKAVQEATNMFSDLPFNVASECDGLIVKADSLLRQLIYNLIDNTRKYGKKTTLVKVYYSKTASGQLQLVYEDDGVGIPNESKGQLFKKGFSTGGSSGFGLFLSKKIIDVYGWNIEEIGEPDKGAKFIITIN